MCARIHVYVRVRGEVRMINRHTYMYTASPCAPGTSNRVQMRLPDSYKFTMFVSGSL